MMAGDTQASLTDKAIAVFAFAAYHELGSGQAVRSVVRQDGSGHKADEEALSELAGKGLVELAGNDASFTEPGRKVLDSVIAAMRSATRG